VARVQRSLRRRRRETSHGSAFYLRRFADSGGRLLVRDRPTGRLRPPITASKLAITDFYTAVNKDGTLDGRMEELLGKVEGEAAQLLKLLLSPLRGRHS
jgi:hypothetical protein